MPRRKAPVLRVIGFLGLRVLGWRADGGFPDVPKAIVIVAPHTSNWDFFVGLFADLAIDLDAHFLGKHSLFRWPVKRLLRWLGGIPVQRGTSKNYVDQLVEEFARRDSLVLAIAPEGTRKKVEHWRSGFYHIARGANVPIVLVALDYGHKVVVIGPVFEPTGDFDADMVGIKAHFSQFTAKHPDQF
jgi:1-acyl-sn-glycerol-3-phosphate acyltransferase